MSSIRFLKTFVAIARYGSFAAAAEQVAVTQAAVGMQMRVLEDQFGQPLFDRHGRSVSLSRYALALLPHIEQIVALYDGLREVQPGDGGGLAGSVTLGAIVSVMGALATRVTQLKVAHPRLDVRLLTGKSLELQARLADREIDAAVIVRLHGRTPKSFSWLPLYDEALVVVAHRDTAASGMVSATALLGARPFLSFDRSQRTGVLIEQAVHRQGVAVNEFLQLNSLDTIIELVRQDIGVAIVPLLRSASWQHDPLLRIVPLPVTCPPRTIGMLVRTDAIRPELMHLLHDSLTTPSRRYSI
jgi:DNA-binding transcriptional LysR family regulator